MARRKNEIIEKLRTPNHFKIYATHAFVGYSTQDIRVELCNEKLRNEKEDRWGFVVDSTVILSPKGAKKLLLSLKKNVGKFEKQYGKITLDDKEQIMNFT